MMLEDKERWNKRYQEKPFRDYVEPIVEKYSQLATVGKALDIACGQGRNTKFLAKMGFEVDGVDLSDYALSQIEQHPNITKIEADLDSYTLEKNRYDLIININYLNRNFFHQIKEALKPQGIVIFETFIIAHGDFDNPQNPEYLLRKNELLHAFLSLDIIYYEERDDINLRGEKTRVASLVAKKSC